MTAQQVVENWKAQQAALNRYAENMKKAINMGLDKDLVKQLSDGSEQSILILDELVNSTEVNVGQINSAFQGLEQAKDTASSMMADVETDFSYKLDQMAREAEDEWGDMADVVGRSIYEMQEYIDSLTGKTVYVDLIARYGDETQFGSNTGNSNNKYPSITWPNYNTPFLAEGAVIPPNAPFTAVLGDQRNGYNLEGPEDMFRSIVREELENTSSQETNELLYNILQTIGGLVINVNESGFFEAMVNQNNLAIRSYGTSPLTR